MLYRLLLLCQTLLNIIKYLNGGFGNPRSRTKYIRNTNFFQKFIILLDIFTWLIEVLFQLGRNILYTHVLHECVHLSLSSSSSPMTKAFSAGTLFACGAFLDGAVNNNQQHYTQIPMSKPEAACCCLQCEAMWP